MKRWRGLKDILQDAVDSGTTAIERVHKSTLKKPYELLSKVKPLEAPIQSIHAAHEAAVTGVYNAIRAVNRAVGDSASALIDALEARANDKRE